MCVCIFGSFSLCVCVLSRPGALCKPSGAPSSVCVLFESVCWVIIEAIVCISFQPHNVSRSAYCEVQGGYGKPYKLRVLQP